MENQKFESKYLKFGKTCLYLNMEFDQGIKNEHISLGFPFQYGV